MAERRKKPFTLCTLFCFHSNLCSRNKNRAVLLSCLLFIHSNMKTSSFTNVTREFCNFSSSAFVKCFNWVSSGIREIWNFFSDILKVFSLLWCGFVSGNSFGRKSVPANIRYRLQSSWYSHKRWERFVLLKQFMEKTEWIWILIINASPAISRNFLSLGIPAQLSSIKAIENTFSSGKFSDRVASKNRLQSRYICMCTTWLFLLFCSSKIRKKILIEKLSHFPVEEKCSSPKLNR